VRIAIAQEIHDGIAQDLIALGYQIDLVLAQPHTPSSVRHEMRTIRHDLSDLIIKVRSEIFNLRKPSEFWLALQRVADQLSPIIEISTGDCAVDPQDEELLLQVIPELLRNSLHHSGATQIRISFTQEKNHLVVAISDNGSGGAKITSDRYGLLGCVERVQSHSATISIETGEKGTTVSITL
jgi:NarL family two-component system sensor histidine kinase LiaS